MILPDYKFKSDFKHFKVTSISAATGSFPRWLSRETSSEGNDRTPSSFLNFTPLTSANTTIATSSIHQQSSTISSSLALIANSISSPTTNIANSVSFPVSSSSLSTTSPSVSSNLPVVSEREFEKEISFENTHAKKLLVKTFSDTEYDTNLNKIQSEENVSKIIDSVNEHNISNRKIHEFSNMI